MYTEAHLSLTIQANISYYIDNIKPPRSEDLKQKSATQRMSNDYFDTLQIRYSQYNNFGKVKARTLLHIFLFVIIAGILSSLGRHGLFLSASIQQHCWMMLVTVNCMLSTFYVYNYCIRFLIMYNFKKYWPIPVFGTVLVIICFMFPELWAFCLGVEIIILGQNIGLRLRGYTFSEGKKCFDKDGRTFMACGLIVGALGALHAFLNNWWFSRMSDIITDWLKINPEFVEYKNLLNMVNITDISINLLFYLLFFAFVLMCILNHINVNYMRSRIGMGNMILNK